MKPVLTIVFALMLASTGHAAVAYRGGGYNHATGYSCGGVYTGTANAAGYHAYSAGTVVTPTVAVPTYGYYGGGSVSPPPPPPAPPVTTPEAGSIVYSLPPGAQPRVVNGLRFYVAQNTWYQVFFGSNGVYYLVAAGPPPGC